MSAWRRQILGLFYFHHVFSQYPSLLSHFQLLSSQSSRHTSSIILPKAGTYFRKSTLFSLSVARNKLPEDIRSLSTTAKFSIAVRRYHSQSMFSLKGIPDFCVWANYMYDSALLHGNVFHCEELRFGPLSCAEEL